MFATKCITNEYFFKPNIFQFLRSLLKSLDRETQRAFIFTPNRKFRLAGQRQLLQIPTFLLVAAEHRSADPPPCREGVRFAVTSPPNAARLFFPLSLNFFPCLFLPLVSLSCPEKVRAGTKQLSGPTWVREREIDRQRAMDYPLCALGRG